MLRFFRRKREDPEKPAAAYETGQDAGVAIAAAIAQFVDGRLDSIERGYLEALRERLKTIHDEADYDPKAVARVEFGLFLAEVERIPERLGSEARSVLADHLALSEVIGVRVEVEALLDDRIAEGAKNLLVSGARLAAETIESV